MHGADAERKPEGSRRGALLQNHHMQFLSERSHYLLRIPRLAVLALAICWPCSEIADAPMRSLVGDGLS